MPDLLTGLTDEDIRTELLSETAASTDDDGTDGDDDGTDGGDADGTDGDDGGADA